MAAYSDPYETWKEQGRPGGSFASWKAEQFPPAPTGTPPAPTPAAPAPAPGGAPAPKPAGPAAPAPAATPMDFNTWSQQWRANAAASGQQIPTDPDQAGIEYEKYKWSAANPNGSTNLGQAGSGTEEQRRTATMPAGSFPDDNQDAGKANTGDAYLDELRSGKVAGSEDWRRFSNAELKNWQPYYVGGGKFRNKFGDIVDKPIDSGPNTPKGVDGLGNKITGGGGGGAGGGGGQGGGSSASSTTASSTAGGGDFAAMLQKNLESMLSGEGSRYNPQAVQGLLASIKQRIESSKGTQVRQAQEEAASRGMSRSGRTGTSLGAIRRGAESQFTSEYGNVLKSKIDADYQDKLAAIDRSQKYLDSMRDELYRRDMSAIQRQQFQANLDLAYANIAYQREALAKSQQYGKDMLAAQYGYGATFGG